MNAIKTHNSYFYSKAKNRLSDTGLAPARLACVKIINPPTGVLMARLSQVEQVFLTSLAE